VKIPLYEERVQKIAPTTEAPQQPNISMPRVVPGAFGADIGAATERLGAIGEKIAGHLKYCAGKPAIAKTCRTAFLTTLTKLSR
jgi:hypothetical protein